MVLLLDPLQWLGLASFVVFAFIMLFPIREWRYKPDGIWLAPPQWVFPVVWTFLYACIGVSGFLFWRSDLEETLSDTKQSFYTAGLFLYFGNLILNKFWTPLFFVAGLPVVAFVDLVLIALTGVAYLVMAGLINTTTTWIAMGLYIPYAAWVVYAGVLNFQYARIYLHERSCARRPRRSI